MSDVGVRNWVGDREAGEADFADHLTQFQPGWQILPTLYYGTPISFHQLASMGMTAIEEKYSEK